MSVVFDAKTGRLRDDGASGPVETVQPERGHGRGKTQRADKTDIGLRGVPVIGHGSGAISDTSPGGELGAAARLERAGKDLVRAHRNRFKARTA